MNINNKCKCGLDKFINKEFCCINCEINNTHNYLCTKYITNKKNKKIFYKQNIKNTNPYNKNNIIKTLFGKENYLFLINDASKSLENHCKNITLFNINSIKEYDKYIKSGKILFFMFPDKEIICKDYLPNQYKILNRDKMNYYKLNFFDLFYDSTELFDITDYEKTDTHINLKGMLKFYNQACKIISKKLNINIKNRDFDIKIKEVIGNGDLIQGVNIGTNIAKKIKENFYYIDENISIINTIYSKKKIYDKNTNIKLLDKNLKNISNNYDKKSLYWDDIKYLIIYSKNENINNNIKAVIFYDSFLASSLNLYTQLFKEVYMIKSIFNTKFIEYINPDFVLEFRIERFLL
jgi:hypothetical protein